MMVRHKWLLAGLGLLMVTSTQAPLTTAQELPDRRIRAKAPDSMSRKLNNHPFIPSSRFYDPFINTWLRQTTGVGVAYDVVTVVDDLEGNPQTFTGDMTFLGLGFGYQQAISSRIAAYLVLAGGARVGIDAETILSTGLNAFVDYSLGGKVRVWNNRQFFLTANLEYSNTSASGVSVLNWAREVVDSGELSDTLLVSSGTAGSFRGGLNLAYAPAPWIGLTGLGMIGAGSAIGDFESEFAYQTQLWASIDLAPITPVPLGFLLGFDRNSFVQQGGGITSSLDAYILGFFYTGRDDFSIGLELQSAKLPLRDVASSISTGEGSINLRYFF